MTPAYFSRLCDVLQAVRESGVVPNEVDVDNAHSEVWLGTDAGKDAVVYVMPTGLATLTLYDVGPPKDTDTPRPIEPGHEREAVAAAVRWVKGEG